MNTFELKEDGYIHESELGDYNYCKDMIRNMIKCIYETGNIAELEDSFEELANQYDVDLPTSEPIIVRRPTSMLEEWTIHNNNYLRTLKDRTI